MAATSLLLAGCPTSANSLGSPTTTGNVTGVWQGAMSYLNESAPIEFMIADDGGLLSGAQIVYDPVSQAEIATDPISGASEGATAQWKTLGGGFVVTGSFAGADFKGSIAMPALDGGSFQASLTLSRTDGGAP